MTVDDLLDEVERASSLRNHEVILSLMSRPCNYQKTKLKVDDFCDVYKDKDIFGIEDFLINDDYLSWRVLRSLRKKLSFKTPCGLCPACRNK
jgi:hypothetical protein